MVCPSCKHQMKEVETESHYGQPMVLDQCVKCGGLWFDVDEVHRVRKSEHEKIEKVDEDKLRLFHEIPSENLLCPKDGAPLKLFKDMNFPAHIIVDHCDQCGGTWFNYGEFGKLQEHKTGRNEMRNAKAAKDEDLTAGLDSETAKRVRMLLDAESTVETHGVIQGIAQHLNTKVNSRGMPYYPVATKDRNAQIGTNIVMAVFYIILRMMFRI